MRRHILPMICIVLLACLLCGCGDSSDLLRVDLYDSARSPLGRTLLIELDGRDYFTGLSFTCEVGGQLLQFANYDGESSFRTADSAHTLTILDEDWQSVYPFEDFCIVRDMTYVGILD